MEVSDDFLNTIGGITPVEGTRDRIIWASVSVCMFSFRSFRRSIAREGSSEERWVALLDLLVPLKVKCFVWQLLRDRLAVRGRLVRLGVIGAKGSVCPLCEREVETDRHLFMHCDHVYRLWSRLASLRGRMLVGAGDMATNFKAWCYDHSRGKKDRVWRMTFPSLVWVI